jgi:hypothetical protein
MRKLEPQVLGNAKLVARLIPIVYRSLPRPGMSRIDTEGLAANEFAKAAQHFLLRSYDAVGLGDSTAVIRRVKTSQASAGSIQPVVMIV